MKNNKFCISKSLVYLVLLVAVILGVGIMVNSLNKLQSTNTQAKEKNKKAVNCVKVENSKCKRSLYKLKILDKTKANKNDSEYYTDNNCYNRIAYSGNIFKSDYCLGNNVNIPEVNKGYLEYNCGYEDKEKTLLKIVRIYIVKNEYCIDNPNCQGKDRFKKIPNDVCKRYGKVIEINVPTISVQLSPSLKKIY